jgi:hypothetical protein
MAVAGGPRPLPPRPCRSVPLECGVGVGCKTAQHLEVTGLQRPTGRDHVVEVDPWWRRIGRCSRSSLLRRGQPLPPARGVGRGHRAGTSRQERGSRRRLSPAAIRGTAVIGNRLVPGCLTVLPCWRTNPGARSSVSARGGNSSGPWPAPEREVRPGSRPHSTVAASPRRRHVSSWASLRWVLRPPAASRSTCANT